ncbi:MAG: rhomboid family intramembrane serine protease [Chloroflexi bacterium]|nr:rhomboid family intramembrane serine protease [Chloroflexota bacterium]
MGMLFFLGFELLRDMLFSAALFPLPVNDYGMVRYRSIPWMTILLIFINCSVFAFWQSPKVYALERMIVALDPDDMNISDDLYRATRDYYDGVVDVWTFGYRAQTVQMGLGVGAFVAFTSMFMHGSFSHLIGNMLYLWAFGRRLEDACGPWRFLLFYLCCGMIAGIGSAIIKTRGLDLPSVGASGAIAGVLGGYLLLFPGASIACLWGIGLILRTLYWGMAQIFGFDEVKWTWTVRMRAFFLLAAFAAMNIVPSLEIIQEGSNIVGIDYLAHLSGFLGALIIFLFVRKDLLARYFSGRRL